MESQTLSALAYARGACAGRLRPSGDLLDLAELQLHRRRPAEDRHAHLEARPLLVHLLDVTLEGGEGAVGHPHLLADLEGHHRLGPLHALLHLVQDAHGLILGDRRRPVVGPEEAGHLRRVLDEVIGAVRHLHLHQHVAREELALRGHLASASHLDHLLGGHQHLLEKIREARGLGAILDRLGHLPFEVRLGVHDVPALAHYLVYLASRPRPAVCRTAASTSRVPTAYCPSLSTNRTTLLITMSVSRKNTEVSATMISTMVVVIQTSFQVGHVTFDVSWRTSSMK